MLGHIILAAVRSASSVPYHRQMSFLGQVALHSLPTGWDSHCLQHGHLSLVEVSWELWQQLQHCLECQLCQLRSLEVAPQAPL